MATSGDLTWPPAGTSTWPLPGTFSWPWTPFEDAKLAYRRSLFYPYSAWAFTIGRAWYQPRMQPVPVCRAILHRMTHAIHENDAFAALGI